MGNISFCPNCGSDNSIEYIRENESFLVYTRCQDCYLFLLSSEWEDPSMRESMLRESIIKLTKQKDWLVNALEDKETYCILCDHFTPDHSYSESAGDTCIHSPGACGHSWEDEADKWIEQMDSELGD